MTHWNERIKSEAKPEESKTDNSDLLSCPFCGSENVESGEALVVKDENYYAQTGCEDCGALGQIKPVPKGKLYDPERNKHADQAWNTRAR